MNKMNKENGLKLRGFRQQNGFSQSYIGEIVGKDHRTISRYELGEVTIPKDVIKLLNSKYHLKLKSQNIKTTSKVSAKTVKEEAIAKSLETVINSLQEILDWVRHG